MDLDSISASFVDYKSLRKSKSEVKWDHKDHFVHGREKHGYLYARYTCCLDN